MLDALSSRCLLWPPHHARPVGDTIGGSATYGVDTRKVLARKQRTVSEVIDKHRWDVHAAYRLGWEVRVSYYERLLRGIITMLEDAQNLMKVDDMSEVIRSLGRVLIELEKTWALIAIWKTEELARHTGNDPDGAS
jgi:hypothetical protein